MSIVIYIGLFISCLLGVESFPHQDSLGIVGGNAVNITEVPFMARYCAVWYYPCCGAAILSERYLISSAMCFYAFWKSDTIAVIGTDLLYEGESYEIDEGYPDPRYSPHAKPDQNGYNIAMLKLVRELEFSAKVQPIKLPEISLEISEGAMLHTLGFGCIYANELKFARQLQMVSVPLTSREKCKQSYGSLPKTMICAGSQFKGSGRFDDGGPLVYENQLVGVLATPRTKGQKDDPSIYTFIPAVRDFIDATLENEKKH